MGLKMTATVIKMSIQRMICTGCGAEANASCNCGKPYEPASVRAAAAVAANPEKSDRAIAADIGVSAMTVNRARQGVTDDTPETRTGQDGKQYPAKPKHHRGRRMSDVPDEPQHDRDLRMLKGVWEGACESAREAFAEWIKTVS